MSLFLSKNTSISKLAKLVVRYHDNDGNSDFYSNGEEKILKAILKDPKTSVILDVGSNNGDWSYLCLVNGYKGKLILFDALPLNLDIAKTKLKKYNLEIVYVPYALSDEEGEVTFYVNDDTSLSGHNSLHDMKSIGYSENTHSITVQAKRLDKILSNYHKGEISFLKIDVEGHELSVLKGTFGLLSKKEVCYIQIEYGHAARAARVYLLDILNYMTPLGYNPHVIMPNGLQPLVYTPFVENKYSMINLLFVSNRVGTTIF